MKRILVALDASERAPQVLAAAVRLSELGGATLVPYQAVGIPPDLPHEIFEHADVELEDLLVRRAREKLASLTRDVASERIEQVVVEIASPWDGICRAARAVEADLIVIGSHGYRGLDRLLGTTASKVVNHATVNVLVVRMPL